MASTAETTARRQVSLCETMRPLQGELVHLAMWRSGIVSLAQHVLCSDRRPERPKSLDGKYNTHTHSAGLQAVYDWKSILVAGSRRSSSVGKTLLSRHQCCVSPSRRSSTPITGLNPGWSSKLNWLFNRPWICCRLLVCNAHLHQPTQGPPLEFLRSHSH